MPRKKKRPEEREGRYQSLVTGKFVSAYYAKRHPQTTRRIEVNEAYRGSGESSEDTAPEGGTGVRRIRTIKNPVQASGRITVKQAREAARSIKERREANRARLLERLAAVAERNAHLRIGQLIVNALPVGRDPFYVEDWELADLLDAFDAKYNAEGGE